MKFEVISTIEISEEDLQYAVKRADYYDWEDRIDILCDYCFWDMVKRIEERTEVYKEDWEWCVFAESVIEEIKRRLELLRQS